jgi:hypothetical protein
MPCVCGVAVCAGLCSSRLKTNDIGDKGATAIGAALDRLTRLQTLEYVVCPAVCGGLRCVLAWELGARGAFGLAFLCLRLVLVQHFRQHHQ